MGLNGQRNYHNNHWEDEMKTDRAIMVTHSNKENSWAKKLHKDERYPPPRRKLEGMKTFCPQCGFDVEIDEDGCCWGCGALATGAAVDKLHITEQPFGQIAPRTTGVTLIDNIKEVMGEANMLKGKMGKDLMIKQGYVPATCTLPDEIAGMIIYSEISSGKSPCEGCNADRSICKGDKT